MLSFASCFNFENLCVHSTDPQQAATLDAQSSPQTLQHSIAKPVSQNLSAYQCLPHLPRGCGQMVPCPFGMATNLLQASNNWFSMSFYPMLPFTACFFLPKNSVRLPVWIHLQRNPPASARRGLETLAKTRGSNLSACSLSWVFNKGWKASIRFGRRTLTSLFTWQTHSHWWISSSLVSGVYLRLKTVKTGPETGCQETSQHHFLIVHACDIKFKK